MRNFDTLSEAIKALQDEGYSHDFNADDKELLLDVVEGPKVNPEIEVVEFHRFEGKTNPSDNSVLYAIETPNGKKGLLVDNYGPYPSEVNPEVLKALHLHARDHQ